MEKTKIDWCDSTWNPVTGCLHGCEYCYARGIAKRFSYEGKTLDAPSELQRTWVNDSKGSGAGNHILRYPVNLLDYGRKVPYPFGFEPTLHKYRLSEYTGKKSRNVFVCSMADLFGSWVPDSWIEEVFKACEKAPQHNYLFLTKNPERYVELISNTGFFVKAKSNMWFGYSYTGKESKQWWNPDYNIFASVEPILEPIEVPHCKWLIVGAETGRRKDKVIPKREWIEQIAEDCKKYNIPLCMKSSLAEIWGEPLIQEFPKGLKK